MKKYYLPAVLLLGFSSMQFTESRGPRIKTVINLKAHNAFIEYSYMTSGYVETMHNSHGFTTSYFYTDTLITRLESNKSGADSFVLNKQGLAEECVGYAGSRFFFDYDADGFLVKSASFFNGVPQGTGQWSIEGGNIQSGVLSQGRNKPVTRTYYSYYPNVPNTIGNKNTGLGFLGSSCRNLLKESATLNNAGDTLEHLIYQYRFDKLDRVIQKVVYRGSGELEDSTSYIYFYN